MEASAQAPLTKVKRTPRTSKTKAPLKVGQLQPKRTPKELASFEAREATEGALAAKVEGIIDQLKDAKTKKKLIIAGSNGPVRACKHTLTEICLSTPAHSRQIIHKNRHIIPQSTHTCICYSNPARLVQPYIHSIMCKHFLCLCQQPVSVITR